MKHLQEMSQGEVGAFVQSHLRKKGITVILSGGAAVSIYSNNRYVSKDLDMVNTSFMKRSVIRKTMEEIGFREEGRYFIHPDSQFFVEFPRGPLAVGSEAVKQINEMEFSTGILKIISPTDCVKDRLAAFFYWGDQQCLTQAILVCNDNEIDMNEVKRWAKAGGKLDEYARIKEKLVGINK